MALERPRNSLLRYVWVYVSLLAALACGAAFVYLLLKRSVPPDARLVLEVISVVGAFSGLSTVGSVLGGHRLLEEEDPAEPLSLKEAGWLLGVPPGILVALLQILFGHPEPGHTYLQVYLFPFIISGAFFALLWAVLGRALARTAGLGLSEYACALFMPPGQYLPLSRRKRAWRVAQRHLLPSLEQAREYLPDIIPALAYRLQHSRRDNEKNLVLALLSDLGDASVAPVLLETLHSERTAHRRAAAVALGKLGVTDAAPALAGLAVEDAEPSVRRSAVVALGKLRAPEALPALQAALQDKEAAIRQSACVALGKLRLDSVRVLLQTCLQDSSEAVRKSAAKALEHLDSDEVDEENGEE
ncbi:MAG: HEAT repeat domain-containing protein [Armatimonadia bacterium]